MLGSFEYIPEVVEKVVKEKTVRKKQELGIEKRPEKISQLEPQNKGSERIQLIMGQLKKVNSLKKIHLKIFKTFFSSKIDLHSKRRISNSLL